MISDKGKKKLLAFHGLDPEKHSDEDVDNAIKNSVTPDDLDDLENRAKAGDEAREKLADEQLEKFANRIGDKPEAKKFFRNALLNDAKGTLAILESMPEPKTPAPKREEPMHNRAKAATPEALEVEKTLKKENERATRVANRARELRGQNPTLQNRAAFDQAESEIPKD